MGLTVYKYQDVICDPASGRPVAGVSVTVKNHADGSLATLYDEAGEVVQPNPVLTDSLGLYSFWCPVGTYDLVCTAGNKSATRTGVYIDGFVDLSGGVVGFATAADMNGDLAHPANTIAWVTNDPTPANNGTYRKTGASGSGVWVQASFDRVVKAENRITALERPSNIFDPSATGVNCSVIASAIADFVLTGTNPTKYYTLTSISRGNGGSWYLRVFQADDTIGSNLVLASQFTTNVSPENGTWQTLSLSQNGGSGVTGVAVVKWENFPANALYSTMWANSYPLAPFVFGNPKSGLVTMAQQLAANTAQLSKIQASIFDPSANGANVAAISAAVSDIRLYGTDPTKFYTLSSISRGNGGTWYLRVYQADTATGTNVIKVAEYSRVASPETGGWQTVNLDTVANGVTGVAIVKWENFPANSLYSSMWANSYKLGAAAFNVIIGGAPAAALESRLNGSGGGILASGVIPVTWNPNAYVDMGTGTLVGSLVYSYSDFIPIKAGSNLSIYGAMPDVSSCCAYDSNKSFISAILYSKTTVGGYSVTLPAGTEYIRLSWKNATQPETVPSSLDYRLNMDRLSFLMGVSTPDLAKVKAIINSPVFNDNIPLTFIDNFYVYVSTGALNPVGGTWRACDFVPVIPGQQITYKGWMYNNGGICGYDKDQVFVCSVLVAPNPPSGIVAEETFTIPDGVYFVRACTEVSKSPYFTLSYATKEFDLDRLMGQVNPVGADKSLALLTAAKNQSVHVASKSLLASNITLTSTAVGRVPAGGGPAPTVALTSGYTHASVVYCPGGWNGHEFWMVVSPYFGATGTDSQYENPHIFCSDDGITWSEPVGISNPLEVPQDYPAVGYLSDPHLELDSDGVMYCFYRGNGTEYGGRGIFYRTSKDGVTWSSKKQLYTTDSLTSLDANNLILSPAYIRDANTYAEFIGIQSSTTGGLTISSQKNQSSIFVFRRGSKAIDSVGEFDASQIVTFTSRPWGGTMDPWHLNVCKVGNLWLMLLTVGVIGSSYGNIVYLAYSKDGWVFDVVPTPLFSNTYRSAIVPISISGNTLTCYAYQASTTDGSISVYRLQILIA